LDPYCPQCGALVKPSARFCSRCGSEAQPSSAPPIVGAQAVPPTRAGARPSFVLIAIKGAAWGLAVEIGFAFAEGLLSGSSLATRSHQSAGYEAGREARHLLLLVGVWPMIVGAAVAVVGTRSRRTE
jgi:hypothetical protein